MGHRNDQTQGSQSYSAALLTGYLTILALLVGLMSWGSRASISGAIIAPAVVRVLNDRQVIQHLIGGVVATIHVRDGDRVLASDILVSLDDTNARLKLSVVQDQLDEISIRSARYSAEKTQHNSVTYPSELWQSAQSNPALRMKMKAEIELFETRRHLLALEKEQLFGQISQFEKRLTATATQVAALREQNQLIENELNNQISLRERGLSQSTKVLELQTNLAKIAGQQGKLLADTARMNGQIAAHRIDLQRLTASGQEQANNHLRGLQFSKVELLGKKQELLNELASLDIRSPVDGVVHASQIFAARSVVQAGVTLMYIVPQEQPLIIASRVNAADVDQVYPGQEASLWFTSFDQQDTAEITGIVTNISADLIINPGESSAYYAVELTPAPGEIEQFDQGNIRPGMPVQAFIKTGDRTPISYLTNPLAEYFRKAFRD